MIQRIKRPAPFDGEVPGVYVPSAKEIEQRAAELRAHWTSRQRSRRAVSAPRRVRVSVVRMTDVYPGETADRWNPGQI